MKTFKDLQFQPHPHGEGLSAKMFFDNGYGISVIRTKTPIHNSVFLYASYTNNENEWEVGALEGSEDSWGLCRDFFHGDEVMGYLSDDQVTEVMKQIQEVDSIGGSNE